MSLIIPSPQRPVVSQSEPAGALKCCFWLAIKWASVLGSNQWNGLVQDVVQACLALMSHPKAGKPASEAVTYFTNNEHRMDYARFLKEGFMIGSGTIESACTQSVTLRIIGRYRTPAVSQTSPAGSQPALEPGRCELC